MEECLLMEELEFLNGQNGCKLFLCLLNVYASIDMRSLLLKKNVLKLEMQCLVQPLKPIGSSKWQHHVNSFDLSKLCYGITLPSAVLSALLLSPNLIMPESIFFLRLCIWLLIQV